MKKKIFTILLTGILFVTGGVTAFASDEIKSEPVVIHEDTSICKEVDITNKSLDSYLNSIEDKSKKDLLKKYFYLPSTEAARVKSFSSSDPVSQAKVMSKLSNAELGRMVDKVEASLPQVMVEQARAYDVQIKEMNKKIEASTKAAGKYSYTLNGSMSGVGGTVAWIKSRVSWQVDSSNQITYLSPVTSTGLTSYYKWQGSTYGSEYVSGGKGYVDKSRDFIVSTQDQSDPYWTVWCSGKFGSSSVPESSNGGWTLTD